MLSLPPAPAGSATVPSGAATTYGKTCASCHGKDGKGNPKMVKMLKVDASAMDLTSAATQGRSDADIAAVIANGKGKMPKYGAKLTPDETTAMVGYLRGLAPSAAPAASSTTMTQAAAASTVMTDAVAPVVPPVPPAAYTKTCASCHGKDALGNEKMTKALKADLAALDLLDDATLGQADDALVKTTTDGKGRMPAYGKKLSPEDIKAIVAWLRSAKPAK